MVRATFDSSPNLLPNRSGGLGAFPKDARACGWALARAHSKVSEISPTISGYLGSSSDEFDEAMGKFALAYADQVERDHAALKAAVRKGTVPAVHES